MLLIYAELEIENVCVNICPGVRNIRLYSRSNKNAMNVWTHYWCGRNILGGLLRCRFEPACTGGQ